MFVDFCKRGLHGQKAGEVISPQESSSQRRTVAKKYILDKPLIDQDIVGPSEADDLIN